MLSARQFKLKEDESKQVSISQEEIDEIVPDADFRFSLIMLKNGDKHFVCGTKSDILQQFSKADD
ncbi:hypothetical protein [Dyadobacter psychrotolerans]|uniref:Uncharacterized protein n=1 Tax=Dyadobacter psychrotolerans TaxID=2541721 RepID=A0A4R5DMQ1_9BACT|nr:hypothetical protein [Dyadobacter psychrotolerans]TDE15429.1 hypothetical protein E0F88_13025 [Dyadobacter psychrotolerans]